MGLRSAGIASISTAISHVGKRAAILVHMEGDTHPVEIEAWEPGEHMTWEQAIDRCQEVHSAILGQWAASLMGNPPASPPAGDAAQKLEVAKGRGRNRRRG